MAKLCKPIIIGSEFCLQASSEGSPRASYCRYIYPSEEATHCCRPCCRVSDLEYLYGSFLQWQWHATAITNPALCPVPLRWHRSHHRTEQVFSDSGARRRAGDTSETPWWGRAAAAGVGLVAGAAACETVIAASRQSGEVQGAISAESGAVDSFGKSILMLSARAIRLMIRVSRTGLVVVCLLLLLIALIQFGGGNLTAGLSTLAGVGLLVVILGCVQLSTRQ